ncbi:MAG: hypothetical protein JWN40_5934 [Phycisphaerales bacterium]|nr:hypothetical protein [Phycisphaerales bacterium]
MGIRETLNKKPALITGVTIGIVVIALVAILLQSRAKPLRPATKAYYTTDDGQTVFADDLGKATPFLRDGVPAVQAHMFSCNDGRSKFVGFLEKLPDKLPAPATPGGRDPRVFAALVKPPKNTNANWVAKNSSEGFAVIAAVQCPEGGGNALPAEVFAQ